MIRFTFLSVLSCAALAFAGCSPPDAPLVLPPAPVVTSAPSVDSKGAPVTQQECEELGRRLQEAIASQNLAVADAIYRIPDLCERAVSDLEFSDEFRKGVLRGISQSNASNLSHQIVGSIKGGGSYNFVRARMGENPPRVVMRILNASGALNYHQLQVVRFPDGSVASQDIDIMLTGEALSQTMRRIFVGIAAEQNRGILPKLVGGERLYTENLEKISLMAQAIREGRPEETYELYKKLPAELQGEKTVMAMTLPAVQRIGNDEYIQMMESFRKKHPRDPSIHVILIDYFALQKKYDQSLECIDIVDKSLGGDAYLMSLRSTILLQAGRYDEAKVASEKAVNALPGLRNVYWPRISLAVKQENHAETRMWLQKLIEDCSFKLNPESIRKLPTYAKFVDSAEFPLFVAWCEEQKK